MNISMICILFMIKMLQIYAENEYMYALNSNRILQTFLTTGSKS
jgi:hypothetical protein